MIENANVKYKWKTISWKYLWTACKFEGVQNVSQLIREALRSIFWKNLGFCPNQVNPIQMLGQLKLNKKIDVVLQFRLFSAY